VPCPGLRFRPGAELFEDRIVPTPVVTIAAAVSGVGEGDGNTAAFVLTRTDTTGSLMVSFTLSGTATNGTDYSASPVFFGMGQATAYILVDPTDDSTSEPTESLVCTLSFGSGYAVGTPDSATIDLLDNDAQVVTVEQVYDASEDGYEGILRLTRIGDLSGALTVNYLVGGTATAEDDYEELSGEVVFAAGSATAEVNVAAVHDAEYDPDETVILTVDTGTGYSSGAEDEATVTIRDDAQSVFELNSEDGAVWYEIDWTEWDPEDDDPQALSLTNFSLLFAGLTFTEANATITNAVALLEDGEVVDIQFEVEFASPVAGLERVIVAGGEVTGIDSTTQQEVGPAEVADKVDAAITLNFSTVDFPTTGNVTWRFSVVYKNGTGEGNNITKTATFTLTPTMTPEDLRLLVEDQLKAWHLRPEGSGSSLLIKGPPGQHLTQVVIVQDGAPQAKGPGVGYRTGTGQSGPPLYYFLPPE
jgi:hypothetical protein